MTIQLSTNDIAQFARVQEDSDKGVNGVLDAGDVVYNRSGQKYTVSSANVASDSALDSFLERATGAKIDLVKESSYSSAKLKYITCRWSGYSPEVRIVQAGTGSLLPLASISAYTAPSTNTGDYNLDASARTYASAYSSYNSALTSFVSAYSMSASVVDGLAAKSRAFADAQAKYLYLLSQYRPAPQIPVPQVPVPQVPVPQIPVPQQPSPGNGNPDND